VFTLGIGSERRLGWCVLAMGMPKDDYKFTLYHKLSIGTLLWGASIKKYLEFIEQGEVLLSHIYESPAVIKLFCIPKLVKMSEQKDSMSH